MAKTAEPLAAQFGGLDRYAAPHTLPPSSSPDTTDAGLYNDVINILGPRHGRKFILNNGSKIYGVVGLNVPALQQRIIADASGAWTPYPATQAPPSLFIGQTPWALLINYSLFRVSLQTNTTVYSPGAQVGVIDLSQYTVWGINQAGTLFKVSAGGGIVQPITCDFQGLIDGLWQNIMELSASGLAGAGKMLVKPATGILTAIRCKYSSPNTGNIFFSGTIQLVLVKGTTSSTTNVSA